MMTNFAFSLDINSNRFMNAVLMLASLVDWGFEIRMRQKSHKHCIVVAIIIRSFLEAHIILCDRVFVLYDEA